MEQRRIPNEKYRDHRRRTGNHSPQDSWQTDGSWNSHSPGEREGDSHPETSVVSKRRDAAYRSGECRDWRKVKTLAWREANRERWRLFERL
jgi:hypothetical protein